MKKTLPFLSLLVCLFLSNWVQAQITGPSDVCLNSTIQLNDGTAGGSWSSTNTGIATVDNTGKVTGVGNGQCTIKYTPGLGNPDTWLVTVGSPAAPAAIVASKTAVCVGISTLQLTDATLNGIWSSDKPSIATVDASGNITGVSNGVTNILYTVSNGCGTSSSIVSITVNDVPSPAAITGTTTLCKGLTTNLSDITTGGVWSDDNAGVISIDKTSGLVTGLKAGTENAYYSVTNGCGSNFVKTLITVDAPLGTPGITPANPTAFCAGTTINLSGTPPNGVWSSDNTSVASVSVTGVVTGNQGGTANISYTLSNSCGTVAAQVPVTVNAVQAVTPAGINGANAVCSNGSTILLTDNTAGGLWSSSNTSVASVDGITGIVTGKAAGTTVISYSIPNSCGAPASTVLNLTVNNCNCASLPSAGTISGPTLATATAATIIAGNTIALTETGATTGNGIKGVWTSSNTTAANVDNNGLVTGSSAGTTNIIYTVTAACGASALTTYPVTVTPAPPSQGICNGLAVNISLNGTEKPIQCITGNQFDFLNGATGGTQFGVNNGYVYKWDFNDATPISGLANPSHNYTKAGDYDVSLTVTDVNGCQAGGVLQIKVGAVPTAGFTTSFQTGGGAGTSFTSTSSIPVGNMTYSWNLGNGTTSVLPNPTVIYQPNTYTVVLTVTGDGGCTDSYAQQVNVTNSTVGPVAPVAALQPSGFSNNSICLGTLGAYLSDATAGGTWSSTNPLVITVDNKGNLTTVSAGTANIEYTVGFGSKATYSITVLTVPVAPGINGITNICTGSSVLFSSGVTGGIWSSSDNTIAPVDVNGNVNGKANGKATISYQVSNVCGASLPSTYAVVVAPCCPPTAPDAILGSSTVQVNKNTTLTLTTPIPAGCTAVWASDNTSIATVVSGVVTGVAAGSANITCSVTNSCGVTTVNYFSINCIPVPVTPVCTLNASFTVNSPAQCITDNNFAFTDATKGGTAPYTYSWVFGDNITSNQQSPSHIYSQAGGYDVILTVVDSKGCSSNAAIQLTVGTVPIASFDVEYNTGTGKGITYISTSSVSAGPLTFSWTFGDGTSSTSSNPTVYYANAGTYKVTLDVTGVGDCKAEDIKYITYGNPTNTIPVAACPNPASGSSTITLSFTPAGSVTSVHAVILDAGGKYVSEQTLTPVSVAGILNIKLDVSSLTTGKTYYVKLYDQNHQLIGVSTIML